MDLPRTLRAIKRNFSLDPISYHRFYRKTTRRRFLRNHNKASSGASPSREAKTSNNRLVVQLEPSRDSRLDRRNQSIINYFYFHTSICARAAANRSTHLSAQSELSCRENIFLFGTDLTQRRVAWQLNELVNSGIFLDFYCRRFLTFDLLRF